MDEPTPEQQATGPAKMVTDLRGAVLSSLTGPSAIRAARQGDRVVVRFWNGGCGDPKELRIAELEAETTALKAQLAKALALLADAKESTMQLRSIVLLGVALCSCRTATGNLSKLPSTQVTSASGQISGIVYDQNGAELSGAKLTLRLNDRLLRGSPKVVYSVEDGSFTFQNLPPGTYTLKLEKPGLKTIKKSNILISDEKSPFLYIVMEIPTIIVEPPMFVEEDGCWIYVPMPQPPSSPYQCVCTTAVDVESTVQGFRLNFSPPGRCPSKGVVSLSGVPVRR